MRAHWILVLMLPVLAACATSRPPAVAPAAPPPCQQLGMASWYHAKAGPTAEGTTATQFSAAHKTLPFGTQVKVTDVDSGKSVVVRIDDRGPFAANRIIDLSAPAATQLGMRQDGVAQVKLEPVPTEQADTPAAACPFTSSSGT